MTDEPNIVARLNQVQTDLGAIAKDKLKNLNYDAFGIDTIYSHIRPLFAKYGVVVVPRLKKVRYEHIQAKSGSAGLAAYVTVDYQFHAPDGSAVTMRFASEGQDYGDKATNKAVQQAFKYGLIQMFQISTGEVDPDAVVVEEVSAIAPEPAKNTPPPSPKVTPQEARDKAVKDAAWNLTDESMPTNRRINEAQALVAQTLEGFGHAPKNKDDVTSVIAQMEILMDDSKRPFTEGGD